ncbi:MAG TPA: lipoyl(octanoyl) transferase LipB [Dehalococcoidia bacterium]
MTGERSGWLVDLGRTAYGEALALQRAVHAAREAGALPDTLLLTEHDPVLTLGRGANAANVTAPAGLLRARGIQVVRVERGGDVTYHGPGQLVAYPVLDLRDHGRDVHRYVRGLEEAAIRTLAAYGVAAGRRDGAPGVWVDGAKVAAVGVFVRRWVTMHGIALNVAPDLSPFGLINPCGMPGCPVTSLERLTGAAPPLAEVAGRFAAAFGELFGLALEPVPPAALRRQVERHALP